MPGLLPTLFETDCAPPVVEVSCRQRAVPCDLNRIVRLVNAALPLCLVAARSLGGPLAGLASVEGSIVGPRAMARVHRDHLGIPGATDVITFPYGEILVCASVAAARASDFGNPVTDEIALYFIHGLLHLAGHDDILPADAARMASAQQEILDSARRMVDPAS